jgi:hypothetical protein
MMIMTAGACGTRIQTNGQDVADPERPLDAALARLKKDNEPGIQNNSITVSDATRCFYTKASQDADDITDTVACGPVRRLGRSDTQVWDTYRLSFGSGADGKATAKVGGVIDRGVTEDPALLVAPGDPSPGDVADVPKPQTPQTAITDHAVALPDAAAPPGLRFTDLAQPARLITPSATIDVTARAEPATVAYQLVQGQHDPAGPAPYYRPAAGQKLYAYKIKISAPAEHDVPRAVGSKPAVSDASTALNLGVGNGRQIKIDGTVGGNQATTGADGKPLTTLTIACGAGTSSETFGCTPQDQEFVVLATVPDGDPVALEATVAGGRQAVDLQTGALTSEVSGLDYGRTKFATRIDQKLTVGPYAVTVPTDDPTGSTDETGSTGAGGTSTPAKTPATTPAKAPTKAPAKAPTSTVKARWSLQVDSATLTAFDPSRGWADQGKAWLLITTSDYTNSDDHHFHDDRVAGLRLDVGGESVEPDGVSDGDLPDDPADTVTWAFPVPEDLTTAQLQFRPTGTVVAGTKPVPFTAAAGDSVEIRLPH